jgi:hypothetical protein
MKTSNPQRNSFPFSATMITQNAMRALQPQFVMSCLWHHAGDGPAEQWSQEVGRAEVLTSFFTSPAGVSFSIATNINQRQTIVALAKDSSELASLENWLMTAFCETCGQR